MENKTNAQHHFFLLFTAILGVSALMLMFLSYTEKQLFAEADPALFVMPFLCYTLAMPCACLAMALLPVYMGINGAGPKSARLWLYLAAAFGTLAVLLFLAASLSVTYLIVL